MITVFGWSVRAPSQLTRLVLVGALSGTLMVLDHRGQQLETLRAGLLVAARPIQYAAAAPARAGSAIVEFFTGGRALQAELESLKTERQTLLAHLQKFEALEAENRRLHGMLGSATRVADRALAAELLEVAHDPGSRKIILDKGSRDGVYTGQPVIDAHGIMGQVTQVASEVARVTLITDPGHAVPAIVNRSGLRVMVFGTGAADTLKVPYLTARADIKEGDLIVSSGMGGTFPYGYPVAQVEKITNDPNESFLTIVARPVAQLNHSKQALLIWPGAKLPKPAEQPAGSSAAKAGGPR
jgi:rod shape-determining protein MreC